MKREKMQPTRCPYYLITRASLVITGKLKHELAAAGVSNVRPAYLGVLISLWQEDGLKVVELGRRAGLEPSTMTGLLDRMEADGLVSRQADPEDRRAHRIVLTQRGRASRERVMSVVDDTLDRVLEGVDEGDLERTRLTLEKLLRNAVGQGAT